eukprot:TRINITY_DN3179_c0_g1_i1.p1 TRINITY_DN3179_c0_g1~~TRINITY_DN3179_c0_g1_i1.p1  ORF type:complete len:386 (-),score=34.82 TRINITY_DN3179_c0_g1_i1:372-1529(-)
MGRTWCLVATLRVINTRVKISSSKSLKKVNSSQPFLQQQRLQQTMKQVFLSMLWCAFFFSVVGAQFSTVSHSSSSASKHQDQNQLGQFHCTTYCNGIEVQDASNVTCFGYMKSVCEVDIDEVSSCSVSTCLGGYTASSDGLHCSGSWKSYAVANITETETGQSFFKSEAYSCVGHFDTVSLHPVSVECDGFLRASNTESSKPMVLDFGSEEVWTQMEEYFKEELYERQEEEDQLEKLVEISQIQSSFEDVNEQSACDDSVYGLSLALNCTAKCNGKAYCENSFFPCVGDFDETCELGLFEGVVELEDKCEGTRIHSFLGNLCLGSYEMSYTYSGVQTRITCVKLQRSQVSVSEDSFKYTFSCSGTFKETISEESLASVVDDSDVF